MLVEMEEAGNLIGVKEAAEKLGLTRKRILDFIRLGRLPAQKIGNSFAIRESDLELVKERKTGRPRTATPSAAALAKRRQREKEGTEK